MNEPDYCERCDLYTMQKQEPEPDETEDVWYCPVCDQFKVIDNSAIVSYNGIITTKNQHHWSRGTGKATFKIDWASILVIRSVPFFK